MLTLKCSKTHWRNILSGDATASVRFGHLEIAVGDRVVLMPEDKSQSIEVVVKEVSRLVRAEDMRKSMGVDHPGLRGEVTVIHWDIHATLPAS